jgi:hypothetical protein
MQSPVCYSAIADRAIGHTGGVISITITKGQDKYNSLFSETRGIKVVPGDDKSNVSFIVAKADTADFTGKRCRLMDNKQKRIDSAGRLECKIDGQWTTFKKSVIQKENDNVALSACLYMGYK